ncbi:MAG: hypothetical protein ABI556_00425 [Gemmatimonadales bacterium]
MLPLSENELDDIVARDRGHGTIPLTDWSTLSVQLRAEGLIRDPVVSRFAARRLMQIAAGLALAVGGAAVGRATAGAPVIPVQTVSTDAPSTSAAAPVSQVIENSNASNASLVSAQFKSPEEAWDVLNRSGEEYQRASAYLSASNNEVPMPTNPSQYRTRLAALDGVMTEIRGAMKEAPEDPVINQYYLATVGAREATLRQLGTTLRPAGVSLNRF